MKTLKHLNSGRASALALLAALQLAGCGGSSSHGSSTSASAKGRVSLSITWPEATSRLIPVASNSIVVSFARASGTVVGTKTVARPTTGNTTTLTIDSLPPDTLTMTASAYPTTDGTGTAQATASQSVAVVANQTTTAAITMASTIVAINLTPAAPSVAAGGTTALTATPVNAAGATVLVSSTLTYSSSAAAIATVSSTGLVTGVSAGTATITVTDSESGKTGTSTVTVTGTGTGTTITSLALAYYNTLTTAQKSATLLAASGTNAAKWSNLPATPSGTVGTNNLRNGVSYSSLTDTQKTAWNNLVNAALVSGQPLTQYNGIRASDNYLATLNNGYSGDYQYVGLVGTPSDTGSWLLQIGGHHIAHNYYYVNNVLQTTTPYFLGVEPTSFTYGGTSYTPLAAQSTAVTNFVKSLTSAQVTAARLNSSFSDVYLGPGKDARSNFPTGTTQRGALASTLTTAQQALLKSVIAAWTNDSPLASTYQALYEGELSSTYYAISGNGQAPTTAFTTNGDYIRVDGPHVWIEFVCQNGVVVSGQIHYHTIWRDRVTDYNAAYGF